MSDLTAFVVRAVAHDAEEARAFAFRRARSHFGSEYIGVQKKPKPEGGPIECRKSSHPNPCPGARVYIVETEAADL